MGTKRTRKSSFKAGMYLLENLTSGMYTDPLAILREYIQNGVDSIDLSRPKEPFNQLDINIELDPTERRISIRDNGQGVPGAFAEEILSSIGSSNKNDPNLRGFRGIGRLGGIAFSDRAIFRTKAENEGLESIQEWDCKKLRQLLVEHKNKSLAFDQLFQRTTSFHQNNSKKADESYFEVTLLGVTSFRNYIFDITRARRYLSQVAPVPFHPEEFKYGQEIDEYFTRKLKHYRNYNVFLNGEKIYKPYKDRVRITKGGFDEITSIDFVELKIDKGEMVACGWYGQRKELLGSIVKGDDSSGIRVRAGNIMLGDDHLLDGCFREPRFNSYVIGEIHVEYDDLMPNSRRDDFVDNRSKSIFYNEVERKIGLPISKEIRLRSKVKSESKGKAPATEEGAKPRINPPPTTRPESQAREEKKSTGEGVPSRSNIFEEILKECRDCPKLAELLNKFKVSPNL
jgi:hypothetical protein